MTAQGTRREGWYADPLGQAELRWWDSQNWTTQVTASRSEDSRAPAAPRPVPLQWADDERLAPEPTRSAQRVSPPTAAPSAEPKVALGSQSANSHPDPEPAAQGGPDWSPLMLTLLRAGNNIVTASAASIPTLTIDMVERTYWWDLSLDSFPAHPVDLEISSIPRGEATTPAVAGRYIEPLLWRVGTSAEALSERIDPTLRYKLRRWPDLASMPHSAGQLRAIKVLASAALTTTELEAITDTSEKEVRVLIGTLSLMSLMGSAKDPVAEH